MAINANPKAVSAFIEARLQTLEDWEGLIDDPESEAWVVDRSQSTTFGNISTLRSGVPPPWQLPTMLSSRR
jgi:hypothetical protein